MGSELRHCGGGIGVNGRDSSRRQDPARVDSTHDGEPRFGALRGVRDRNAAFGKGLCFVRRFGD